MQLTYTRANNTICLMICTAMYVYIYKDVSDMRDRDDEMRQDTY